MTANKLKLNREKTEFLVFVSPYYEKDIIVKELNLNGDVVKRSHTARNLGVIMDSSMHMDNHIAYLKKN